MSGGSGLVAAALGAKDWQRSSTRVAYQGGHRAPSGADDVAAPLHDVEEMMPNYYEHPEWYSHDRGQVDAETSRVIRDAQGQPDKMITIYRALPPGFTTINDGDWVTISRTYALGHAMQSDDPSEDWPVITAQVPARTLWTEGYAAEWGYDGSPVSARLARAHVGSPSLLRSAMPDSEGWLYHFGTGLDRHEMGQYVHLGTREAATKRHENLHGSGNYRHDGLLLRAKVRPRNPIGSPSSPMSDHEANALLLWESGSVSERGEMPGPENDGDQKNWAYTRAGTIEQIAEKYGYQGAWMHDALWYRNDVEDPGSISVAVDPDCITDEGEAPPTNPDVGEGQLLLWGARHRRLAATTYYHGTSVSLPAGTRITPSQPLADPGDWDTDQDFRLPMERHNDQAVAYATLSESDAWWWAEHSWNAGRGDTPRVYEVRPLGDVYTDPNGEFEGDRVSPWGFEVVREVTSGDGYEFWHEGSVRTAGPASNTVPLGRFPIVSPTPHYGPRDVKVLRMAQQDIDRLHPGQKARVMDAIDDLRAGRATPEPKSRNPLVNTYTLRVTRSLRMGVFLTVDQPDTPNPDDDWVVYWIGDHTYEEAERRMRLNAARMTSEQAADETTQEQHERSRDMFFLRNGRDGEDLGQHDGITYEFQGWVDTPWGTDGGRIIAYQGMSTIGSLEWIEHTISSVWVAHAYRRQGIATSLLEHARRLTPELQHSTLLSDDGRAWSEHVGSLPGGINLVFSDFDAALPRIRAEDADERMIGTLSWWGSTGEIFSVQVDEAYRRQGIATAMWDLAKEHEPRLHHSTDLSEDGREWSQKVGAASTRTASYFHGSDREFDPGDLILPQAETGAPNWAEQLGHTGPLGPHYDPNQVYLSDTNYDAGVFGNYVYEVEPEGEIEIDPESAHLRSGYRGQPVWSRAPRARVVRKVIGSAGDAWMQAAGCRMHHNAAAGGNYRYVHEPSRSEYGGVVTHPRMVAFDGQREVGFLDWDFSDPRLFGTVKVDPAYRGQGIATRLWEEAKKVNPDLDPEESVFFTPAGRGWVDSLTKTAFASGRDGRGWAEHVGATPGPLTSVDTQAGAMAVSLEDNPYPSGTTGLAGHIDGVRVCELFWWSLPEGTVSDGMTSEGKGVIWRVWTSAGYRRQGLASILLRMARDIEPGLRHSTELSDDGRAWSEHVGSRSQFFHGTDVALGVGDVILPGAEVGRANYDYAEHGYANDRVFITTDESAAWAYAKSQTHYRSTGYVYRVEPMGGATPDPRPGGWGQQTEFSAPAARVVEVMRRLVIPRESLSDPEAHAEHMRTHHPGETSHLRAHTRMVTDHDHDLSGPMTRAASARTVYRGMPLWVQSEDDARTLLAGGPAAAQTLLRLLAEHDGGLGVWWTSEAGEVYSHAEATSGDYALSLRGSIEGVDNGTDRFAGCEVPVVLTANAPTVWEQDDWEVAEGSQIDLVSIRYSVFSSDDNAWIEVPVGRTLTASVPMEAVGSLGSVPPEPGASPIPPGTTRLYHVTPERNLDAIRQQGLLVDRSVANMGAGSATWASKELDYWRGDPGVVMVEFYATQEQMDSRLEWSATAAHVGLTEDIPPSQFVAVHEPWHRMYHHILRSPATLAQTLAGENDGASDPDVRRAVDEIKRTGSLHTAADLMLSQDVYYRVHHLQRAFSLDDAWSAPLTISFDDHLDEPRRGYSACYTPWDLWAYVVLQSWVDRTSRDEILIFSGEEVGDGVDGEPLIEPDFRTVKWLSWRDFLWALSRMTGRIPEQIRGPLGSMPTFLVAQKALEQDRNDPVAQRIMADLFPQETWEHALPQYGMMPLAASLAHLVTGSLTMRTYYGKPGRRDHITGDATGTLPIEYVRNMPGKMGEVPGAHRNKQGQEWEAFKADVATRGIINPIFIVVEENGVDAFIYEGNHRRDAAVETGMSEVPVHIRFFGKSEDVHPLGSLPERLPPSASLGSKVATKASLLPDVGPTASAGLVGLALEAQDRISPQVQTYPPVHGGKYHARRDPVSEVALCRSTVLLDLEAMPTMADPTGKNHPIVCTRCMALSRKQAL